MTTAEQGWKLLPQGTREKIVHYNINVTIVLIIVIRANELSVTQDGLRTGGGGVV